jgi:hypothetical protein
MRSGEVSPLRQAALLGGLAKKPSGIADFIEEFITCRRMITTLDIVL